MIRKANRWWKFPLFFLLPIVFLSSYAFRAGQADAQKRITPQEGVADWTQILVEDVEFEDYFGQTAAMHGDVLAVSAIGAKAIEASNEDTSGLGPDGRNAGAVYLFERGESGWSAPVKLMAEDARPGDNFSLSLALGEEVLAVGAPYKKVPPGGMAAGAVYIFQRQGETWTQQARLTAPDGAPFDLFGNALALQGDLLAVGARSADHPQAGRNAGAVYIYRRAGGEWMLEQKLFPEDAGETDYFGQELILYENSLLVSAPGHNLNDRVHNSGIIYIFQQRGQNWRQSGTLTPRNQRALAQFGQSMDINFSTGTLVVSALGEMENSAGDLPPMLFSPPGMIHVYERRGSGWRHQAEVTSNRPVDFNFILFANPKVEIGGKPQTGELIASLSEGELIASLPVGVFQRRGADWVEVPYEEFLPPALPGSGMTQFSGSLLVMSAEAIVFGTSPYAHDTPLGILLVREIK
jgi:hypothetical protein